MMAGAALPDPVAARRALIAILAAVINRAAATYTAPTEALARQAFTCAEIVVRGGKPLFAAFWTNGSKAQEADFAKLRTVFALRNLTGPLLPFTVPCNCRGAARQSRH